MRLGKEIPVKEFNKWLEALRSGKYRKTTHQMEKISKSGNHYYCALGLLCKITMEEKDIVRDSEGKMHSNTPKEQPKAPQWVKDINGDVYMRNEPRRIFDRRCSIIDMNDTHKYSFKKIADKLEKIYKRSK